MLTNTEIQNHYTHKDVEYVEGDRVYISGETGKFFFVSYEKNLDNDAEWVNIWQENYYMRSFRPDRIVNKKAKKKKVKKGEQSVSEKICSDHPNYTARRTPRTGCARCWAAYEARK